MMTFSSTSTCSKPCLASLVLGLLTATTSAWAPVQQKATSGLGYAPVSAAEEVLMQDIQQQRQQQQQRQPNLGFREPGSSHSQDFAMFAEPQQQQQTAEPASRRYFREDPPAGGLAMPSRPQQQQRQRQQQAFPVAPPQHRQQHQQTLTNRQVAEIMYREKMMEQLEQRQHQQQHHQQNFVEQHQHAETSLDFGTRWGQVLPDMEAEELPLMVTIQNTMFCPTSLSIYFSTKLLGWEEVLPDSDSPERSFEGPYNGYEQVSNKSKLHEKKLLRLKGKSGLERPMVMLGGSTR